MGHLFNVLSAELGVQSPMPCGVGEWKESPDAVLVPKGFLWGQEGNVNDLKCHKAVR
jgi:hypothetical protein